MIHHQILNQNDLNDFKDYILNNNLSNANLTIKNGGYLISFEQHEDFFINMSPGNWTNGNEVNNWILNLRQNKKKQEVIIDDDSLIFGKDKTNNIVSIEVKDNQIELFIEKDGVVTSEFRPNKYWIVSNRPFTKDCKRLDGDLHYKYIKYYDNSEKFYTDKREYKHEEIFSLSDAKESAMILNGITYYKGMKVNDVSRLHFDLETTGLLHNDESRVLLISTTFISNNKTYKKLFACDEYNSDKEMLEDFCNYIKKCNPSIIAGFNIFMYDFPYLSHCAKMNGVNLSLGRDSSDLKYNNYESKFRKDGSQDYNYKRCFIYGREIVDLMFVAYHFDIGRKYDSYKLKVIIKQEGLEKPNRQFYDASTIYKNWNNLEERKKIKDYCIDDSDDSESLFQLMIPSFFYLTRSIPKTFQVMNYSATGSQINSFLIRAYMQENHSLPKASEPIRFPGAISRGIPGIYKNCWKFDAVAMYPSVIIEENIFDKNKDPKGYFLKMVKYFTDERKSNKKKAKETGDRYYKDLEQSEKVVINSSYGLLGSVGLLFNSPVLAALVTEKGREILKKAILWSTGVEFKEEIQQIEEKEDIDENT